MKNKEKDGFHIFYKRFFIVILLVTVLSIVFVLSLTENSKEEALPRPTKAPLEEGFILHISHESGFYRSNINLVLSSNKEESDILYTITDPNNYEEKKTEKGEAYVHRGSFCPSYENLDKEGLEKTYIFEEGIFLEKASKKGKLNIYVIKAQLVDKEGKESKVYTFTYMLGNSFNFDNYFVNLSVNEDDLYSHDKGIFINGKTYYDELISNPNRYVGEFFPRNYLARGKEWEREALLQIFDNSGKLLVEENVGLRINGAMSRHFSAKSLKIIAREEYGNTSIDYPIFAGKKDKYGSLIKSYDRFILRTSANDYQGTMFKDVLIQKIGGLFSIDYQEGSPCNVYINGNYYCMMNIRQSLDRDYVESMYGIPKEYVDMVGIRYTEGYKFYYRATSGDEGANEVFIGDLNKIVSKDYSKLSLEDMSEFFDIENFIDYMAYEIYAANTDWPHNNVLVWRYNGHKVNSVKGMDGKWRFILKDLDYANAFTNYSHNTLESALSVRMANGPSLGQVLKAFMANDEFKDLFLGKLLYYSEEISQKLVSDLVKEMRKERENDIRLFWDAYNLKSEVFYRISDNFIRFAKERPKHIKKIVEEFL